jgi:hypothetical protein
MSEVTIADVGRMFGLNLPAGPGKCFCPIRKHQRKDKTFRVFRIPEGKLMWKCWSCDAPDNAGDAVKLYAVLGRMDRRDAWKALRDQGLEVPGGNDRRPSQPYVVPVHPAQRVTPAHGTVPSSYLPLDQALLASWRSHPFDEVRAFLRTRAIPDEFDAQGAGAVALPGDCMGFVYIDPETGVPCRVKVRGLRRKSFWNEPRSNPDIPGAKAKAPLFLADSLDVSASSVIIVEGELDAFSLVSQGFKNVVSLPDGSESAGTVSIEPIIGDYSTWFVATDDDEPGAKAWRTLRDRAHAAGVDAARVKWSWLVGEDDEQSFKDANDALMGGFSREDFEECMNIVRPGVLRRAS